LAGLFNQLLDLRHEATDPPDLARLRPGQESQNSAGVNRTDQLRMPTSSGPFLRLGLSCPFYISALGLLFDQNHPSYDARCEYATLIPRFGKAYRFQNIALALWRTSKEVRFWPLPPVTLGFANPAWWIGVL